jgi:long-chain fatty acid transport protein
MIRRALTFASWHRRRRNRFVLRRNVVKLRIISLATGIALAGAAGSAFAGAFGIATQSGSGTGNAYAAGAAGAEDAGSAWHNPASMSLLPPGKHVSVAGHLLRPSFKFRDEGSTIPAGLGAGNGGDGGDWAVVPNGAFVMALDNRLSFGLSVNAPFGLKTEYDPGWVGQRIALMSEIVAVNVNPALSYKVSPALSVGVGLNVQYLES